MQKDLEILNNFNFKYKYFVVSNSETLILSSKGSNRTFEQTKTIMGKKLNIFIDDF
jgi:rRNA-processing protein FCF1